MSQSNISGGLLPFSNTTLPTGLPGNASFINSSETLLQQLLNDDLPDLDFADLNITEGMYKIYALRQLWMSYPIVLTASVPLRLESDRDLVDQYRSKLTWRVLAVILKGW